MAQSGTACDVTIIGSGPGGYVAAVRAAQLGLKTAVVEMAALPGGTCLHWGCIPTKAMLKTAEVIESARHAASFGVKVAPPDLDLAAMHKYKDKVVLSNPPGVEYLFKKHGVAVLAGRGTLAGKGKVKVTALAWLERKLGRFYLPIALFVAAAGPIMQVRYGFGPPFLGTILLYVASVILYRAFFWRGQPQGVLETTPGD